MREAIKRQAWQTSAIRITRLLTFAALLCGSLLAFPSVFPFVVAIWVGVYAICIFNRRPGWLALVAIVLIILVKNVDWPISVPVFLAIAVANLILVRRAQIPPTGLLRPAARIGLLALCLAVAWILVDWHFAATVQSHPVLQQAKSVICLGDSLTSAGYPKYMADILSVPVVDWGRDGINSFEALALLSPNGTLAPELESCQAIVIEIGGHDFNQGNGRGDTRDSLRTMIQLCQANGISVVLVEIPRGFVFDGFGGMERSLARQYDLQLIADSTIRWFVLYSPILPPGMWLGKSSYLSDDGLHPNDRGSQLMAREVSRALAKVYGAGILQK